MGNDQLPLNRNSVIENLTKHRDHLVSFDMIHVATRLSYSSVICFDIVTFCKTTLICLCFVIKYRYFLLLFYLEVVMYYYYYLQFVISLFIVCNSHGFIILM